MTEKNQPSESKIHQLLPFPAVIHMAEGEDACFALCCQVCGAPVAIGNGGVSAYDPTRTPFPPIADRQSSIVHHPGACSEELDRLLGADNLIQFEMVEHLLGEMHQAIQITGMRPQA